MSLEPERPIEKLLRASAKKRREEAGNSLELHPATRRVLQGEVARRFAKRERKPLSWLGLGIKFWPKFALGLTGSVILLAALCFFSFQSGHDKSAALFAKNELSSQRSAVPQGSVSQDLAPSVIPSPPEQLANSRVQLAQKAEVGQRDDGASLELRDAEHEALASADAREKDSTQAAGAAPLESNAKQLAGEPAPWTVTPTITTAGATLLPGQSGVVLQNAPTAPSDAPSPLTTLALAPERQTTINSAQLQAVATSQPSGFGYVDSMIAGDTNVIFRSSFVSVNDKQTRLKESFDQSSERRAKAALLGTSEASTPVLASFQLEQNSQGVRVLDNDGSVYTGFLQTSSQASGKALTTSQNRILEELAKKTQARSAVQNGQSSSTPAADYMFTVAGTNLTLKQQVLFSGRLVPSTNPAVFRGVSAQQLGRQLSGRPQQAGSSPFLNKRIVGTALIGDRTEVTIDANPTPPPP